jgi:hypothetical protein
MIEDDCKKLRHQLEQVAWAESNEKIVEQLNFRKQDLHILKEKVIAATTAFQAIASRTAIIGKLDATKAFKRVQALRVALMDDPQSITKGRDLTNLTSAFDKFTDDVTKATTATWEQYLARTRPNVDLNQLAQAEQQEAFKTKVAQLKSRFKEAESLSKNPPATEAKFAELEAVWEEIRTLRESLPSVTDDPKVREFLKAANAPKGASLEMLTAEVLAWLNENKTHDKYRIFNV